MLADHPLGPRLLFLTQMSGVLWSQVPSLQLLLLGFNTGGVLSAPHIRERVPSLSLLRDTVRFFLPILVLIK